MSSQQWKLQSGASRSRNVKATSVLFERSNFWQRGSNLELYHDNDGSTTLVGVGTTTPVSRLSFGDTARQRRLAYSNDGNFAFCEKSDGSEATGIGFYERFDNFDETSTRLFTGLKFIVNRDNNNNFDIKIIDNSKNSMKCKSFFKFSPLLDPVKFMVGNCLLYTSPSPRDKRQSRMPSSA